MYSFNKRLIIEYENTDVSVGYGDTPDESKWLLLKNTMSKMKVVSGGTEISLDSEFPVHNVEFIIPYDVRLNESNFTDKRVIYNGQEYKILDSREIHDTQIGLQQLLKLTCIKFLEVDR